MFRLLGIILVFIAANYSLLSQYPKILWWFDTFDSAYGQTAFDDVDGDGKYELVFGCYRNDSCVYVLNGEDGSLKWRFNTTDYQEGCNDVATLLFDINHDGISEIFVPSSCNPFTYCLDGKNNSIIWKTTTKGSDSPPVLADIENDGKFELLHGEFGGYVICIDAETGSVKWEILVDDRSWIQTAPTVTDINKDGYLDFVVSTWQFDKKNSFYAYDGKTLEIIWKVDLNDYVYHGTALIDLNFDGYSDFVFGDYSGTLWAINGKDGTIIWTHKAFSYIGAPVTVADLNNDGICEIIFVSLYKIQCLDINGNLLWAFDELNYGNVFRGTVVSDIDLDGTKEVIFGSSSGILYALDGINGSTKWTFNLSQHIEKDFDINHAPVIGDFNKDGFLDLFIVGGKTDYPDFSNNYGRAYCLEIGTGKEEWKMFQNNYHRSCGTCFNNSVSVMDLSLLEPTITFSNGELNIYNLNTQHQYHLQICDLLGNVILTDDINEINYYKSFNDLSYLYSNILIAKLTNRKNNSQIVKKIVIL